MRGTIEELIEGNGDAETAIGPDERQLITNIIELREITAVDVMVPRIDIVAVPEDMPLADLVKEMTKAAHSRMPVYRETLDDVVGMVHIKDVLQYWGAAKQATLKSLLRKVMFVSPSMRALDLLLQMRAARIHLALVVDEFGGIDGLITIEDLVEQIVGEIDDEHDVVEGPKIVEHKDADGARWLLADARATVEEFEEVVGQVLDEDEREETDTLGGLVFMLAGRVPARGEVVRHESGIEFEVTDVDPRRIKRLRVRNLPDSEPATPPEDTGA
ncbi:magnesium/cobalt efflux protein [Oceanibaculum pacificum]|uniref:Magnesium/cobalt efflux protein n=2 Tax=Oceanibaculum pacificum TaxID=580166 RepID=A0A154VSH6_9PROT|nr:magnesium/cobalt efflux protein [Oceanibaculum pacificum]